MTDPDPDVAAGATRPNQVAVPAAAVAQAGWYPDPWDRRQHRYWDGAAWTAHAFPSGPAGPADRDAAWPAAAATSGWAPAAGDTRQFPAVASDDDTQPPPPPRWAPPAYSGEHGDTVQLPGGPPAGPPPDRRGRRLPTGRALVAAFVLLALLVGVVAGLTTYYAMRPSSSKTPAAEGPQSPTTPSTTPGTTPAAPADRDAAVLPGLVVAQADVAQSVTVQPLVNGDQVSGEATLDLCNGNFPSEAMRTARLQVDASDNQAKTLLSTEAVLYQNPSATTQALAELKSVAASCPNRPVESPVGEPTVTTKFNAPPDSGWAQVPTVDRQAYDFVSTDTNGQSQHSVAVYLRRGRVLMGVYFSQPDGAQSPVRGQTTIGGITNVFANRMAQLPASVVNGG